VRSGEAKCRGSILGEVGGAREWLLERVQSAKSVPAGGTPKISSLFNAHAGKPRNFPKYSSLVANHECESMSLILRYCCCENWILNNVGTSLADKPQKMDPLEYHHPISHRDACVHGLDDALVLRRFHSANSFSPSE